MDAQLHCNRSPPDGVRIRGAGRRSCAILVPLCRRLVRPRVDRRAVRQSGEDGGSARLISWKLKVSAGGLMRARSIGVVLGVVMATLGTEQPRQAVAVNLEPEAKSSVGSGAAAEVLA